MKKLSKIIGIISGLCCATATLASELSYDQLSITSQTWEEVDLTYTNTIGGEKYTEHANLLRPISWIKHNHLDLVGTSVHLSKDQLGIDADVKVMAIKPATLNYSASNHEKIKPVIATFITHADDVWDYTFKDQGGKTEAISAAASHPVYSADRLAFIPIGQLGIGEHSYDNKAILISKHKHNKAVEQVYNFEVYESHRYFIGNSLSIQVHNPDCNGTGTPEGGTEGRGPIPSVFLQIEPVLHRAPGITVERTPPRRNVFMRFLEWIFGEYQPDNIVIGGPINGGISRVSTSFSGLMVRVQRAYGYIAGVERNLGMQFIDFRGGLAYADGVELSVFGNFTSARGASVRAGGAQVYLMGFDETARGLSLNAAGTTTTVTASDMSASFLSLQVAGINAGFTGVDNSRAFLSISLSLLDFSETGASIGRTWYGINGSLNRGLTYNGRTIYPPLPWFQD